MRRKFFLLSEQREGEPALNLVDDAISLSREIIARETKGPGDLAPALRRLSHRSRLPHSFWWRALYRPPKDLTLTKFALLVEFHRAEASSRQRKKFENETIGFTPRSPLGRALFDAAFALDRACDDLDCEAD
jgi:hypothetical protein